MEVSQQGRARHALLRVSAVRPPSRASPLGTDRSGRSSPLTPSKGLLIALPTEKSPPTGTRPPLATTTRRSSSISIAPTCAPPRGTLPSFAPRSGGGARAIFSSESPRRLIVHYEVWRPTRRSWFAIALPRRARRPCLDQVRQSIASPPGPMCRAPTHGPRR